MTDEAESLLVQGIPTILSSPAASSGRKREVLENVIAFYEATSRPDLAQRYRENLEDLNK